ncbi:hypothetical protein C8R44DRAFT_866397 [Mycena epipterygia]|nr:hypothetical protein C8R44DRAFT_866397 [Mycena epipterygia]
MEPPFQSTAIDDSLSTDSRFESMLYTNATPSDIECDAIRDFVAGPRKEAARLTEEISRMQTLIEKLVQKRAEVNEFIDAHLALVSPARRLPSDIVRTIFTASLPASRNCAMTGQDSPLLLCQICSAWRELALSTPRLWSSPHIVVPDHSRMKALVEMVALWLSRSGIIPLSFSVVVSRACEYDCDLKPLLDFLAEFSRRWKSIHIILPTLDSFEIFASLSAEDVPMLQDAVVGGVIPSFEANSPWDSLAFLAAPSLLSLSITEGCHFPALNYLSKRLVHLRIMSKPTEDLSFPLTSAIVLGLLQQFPVLETCELALVGEAQSSWTGGSVVLPRLHHLSLWNQTLEREADLLFADLILPNMRSVDYRLTSASANALPFSPLVPALQRLRLDIVYIRGSVLLDYLRPAQHLEDLRLSGTPTFSPEDWAYDQPDMMFFLTHFGPHSEQPLCPRLRRLELHDTSVVSDDDPFAIIQARAGSDRGSVARLMQFSATIPRAMEWDIMPELQPFIDEGLEVSLAYHPPLLPPPRVYSPWDFI